MLAALLARPVRILAVLATVLCAGGVAASSGASFSSTSRHPTNTLVSGTLLQTNSRGGETILSAGGMRPGDTRSGDVTIANTGTLGGTFTLRETGATNTFTAGSMTLEVSDLATGTTVYDGDVGGLGTRSLGAFSASESRTFRFTARLSASAPNADQGKTAGASYAWSSVPTG